VAVRDRKARFIALLHHVTIGWLRHAYDALSKDAALGTDGGGRSTGRSSRRISPSRTSGSDRERTAQERRGVSTSRRRTGGNGRSASPRWRTRSSSGPSSSAQRHLRGGLLRFFVRIPARPQPTRCAERGRRETRRACVFSPIPESTSLPREPRRPSYLSRRPNSTHWEPRRTSSARTSETGRGQGDVLFRNANLIGLLFEGCVGSPTLAWHAFC
jgi:hypothetical protein